MVGSARVHRLLQPSSHGEIILSEFSQLSLDESMYASKGVRYFGNCRPEMIERVPNHALTVLEVGCGNGGFAAALKERRRMLRVTAIESYPDAAREARANVDELIEGTLDDAIPLLLGRQFDCVVMNDVIEHLIDPWSALRQLRCLLTPTTGRFVASIPNVRYLPVFKAYVQEARWTYEQQGVMDRTHLRWFTQRSIHDLFRDTGYVPESVEGINGCGLPWKLSVINRLTRGSLDDLRFMQFACVARPL